MALVLQVAVRSEEPYKLQGYSILKSLSAPDYISDPDATGELALVLSTATRNNCCIAHFSCASARHLRHKHIFQKSHTHQDQQLCSLVARFRSVSDNSWLFDIGLCSTDASPRHKYRSACLPLHQPKTYCINHDIQSFLVLPALLCAARQLRSCMIPCQPVMSPTARAPSKACEVPYNTIGA